MEVEKLKGSKVREDLMYIIENLLNNLSKIERVVNQRQDTTLYPDSACIHVFRNGIRHTGYNIYEKGETERIR